LADGDFAVAGTHAYSADGTYSATVSVADGQGASATATATLSAGDLYPGLATSLTVARFTDANPAATITDYSASIDWGDGTTTTGTVAPVSGGYNVSGTHTYAGDGNNTATVTVSDDGGNSLTSTRAVAVVRPAVAATEGAVEGSTAGALTSAELAVFTEPDPADASSEFSATVDWGDGSTGVGTVTGSGGEFHVVGSHNYEYSGIYPVRVTVSQAWGAVKPDVWLGAQAWVPAAPGDTAPTVQEDHNFVNMNVSVNSLDVREEGSFGVLTGATHLGPGLVTLEILPGHGPTQAEDPQDPVVWETTKEGQYTGRFYYQAKAGWSWGDSFAFVVREGNHQSNVGYVAIGQAHPGGWTAFFAGNAGQSNAARQGGLLLAGGGTDQPDAFQWFSKQAHQGDILNLSTSEAGTYGPWILDKAGADAPNSVRTIAFDPRQAASVRNPVAVALVGQVQAVFLPGGDQGRFFDLLMPNGQPTDLVTALNKALTATPALTIGGTSAGLAMLGQVIYANTPGTSVTSAGVLAKPFDPALRLVKPFLTVPLLTDVVTDTHFEQRGRMGRLVVFMARMMNKLPAGVAGPPRAEVLPGNQVALGLGVDPQTAVLVDAKGNGRVVGANNTSYAYFLAAPVRPAAFVLRDTKKPATALTYAAVRVYRLAPGGTVTFAPDAWAQFNGAITYQVQADNGVLKSFPKPGGNLY
jgi:cyanophycinase-like exopeptidase